MRAHLLLESGLGKLSPYSLHDAEGLWGALLRTFPARSYTPPRESSAPLLPEEQECPSSKATLGVSTETGLDPGFITLQTCFPTLLVPLGFLHSEL